MLLVESDALSAYEHAQNMLSREKMVKLFKILPQHFIDGYHRIHLYFSLLLCLFQNCGFYPCYVNII